MCTRFTLHRGKASVEAAARALGVSLPAGEAGEVAADYNVALTRRVPVFVRETEPCLRWMTWGFLPFYERGRAPAKLLPNARSETAASSPVFRAAVAGRRCVVPADGFYEWAVRGHARVPHLFTLRRGEPLAFAGIWEPGGCNGEMDTFAVLTTTPNALVAPVHDRMPVILREADLGQWLGGGGGLSAAEYARLVLPLDAGLMEVRELGPWVGNVRNNGPRCHEGPETAADEAAGQGELF